jgi:small redox-active disulfide protein 2
MISIKVLGTGCPKCKSTYHNVMTALEQSGMEAHVEKIEEIEEILKYNVMTTPALLVNDVVKTKGRVADVNEIIAFLKAS